MRLFAAAVGLAALAAPALADINYAVETDVYRFGGTYAALPAETPIQCARACADDVRCLAWSHSAVSNEYAASCELKHNAGRSEMRPGFTSGISISHAVRFTDIRVPSGSSHSELAGGRPSRADSLATPRPAGVGASVRTSPATAARQPRRVTNWSFAPDGGQSEGYYPNSSETRPTYSSGPESRPPPDFGREQPQY